MTCSRRWASGQSLQLEFAVRAFGKNNGPTLGIEDMNGIVQDRMKQFFFALNANRGDGRPAGGP